MITSPLFRVRAGKVREADRGPVAPKEAEAVLAGQFHYFTPCSKPLWKEKMIIIVLQMEKPNAEPSWACPGPHGHVTRVWVQPNRS